MRFLPLLSILPVAAFGYATTALAHRSASGEGHWEAVGQLERAFGHTANFRRGVGRCCVGHPRLPGVPAGLREMSKGLGVICAEGPAAGGERVSVSGRWNAANVGSWSQRWESMRGAWETDRYETFGDGSARLQVATGAGLRLSLAFAPGRSGSGTVAMGRGLDGRIEWDGQGDGKVVWADGSSQAFEDWRM